MTLHRDKPTAWMADANCLGVGADLMFPGRGETIDAALAVCASCRVKAECLEYAMTPPVEQQGIYGGMSERQRRRRRAELRSAAPIDRAEVS